MPAPVVDAIKNYIDEEAIEGGYETFNRHEEDFERFYQQAARLINCHSGEIAFVENATRAWDMIFYSLPWKAGDVILTSMAEYASNYIAYLQLNKKFGVEVKAVPNASDGALCVDSLKKMIDARTALVAVTHVPTNGGLVNPAIEIGRVARERELPYLLDACQSVGQLDVDVEEIGCDFLSATGRKYLRGPRGTGFLYVRKSRIKNIEPVFLDLHAATWVAKDSFEIRDDARRFENDRFDAVLPGQGGDAAYLQRPLRLAVGLGPAARIADDRHGAQIAHHPRQRHRDHGMRRRGGLRRGGAKHVDLKQHPLAGFDELPQAAQGLQSPDEGLRHLLQVVFPAFHQSHAAHGGPPKNLGSKG